MDDETVIHESSKQHVGPDLEEHIELESSPNVSQTDVERATEKSDAHPRDVEMLDTDIADPEPVKVPRSQRRGLFGRFSILAEVEEPKHYSTRVKWYITFVVALAAIAAPLGSTIIFRMTSIESTTYPANNL